MDFISLDAFQNRAARRLALESFSGGDKPILLIEDMNLDFHQSQPKSLVFGKSSINKRFRWIPINIIAEI